MGPTHHCQWWFLRDVANPLLFLQIGQQVLLNNTTRGKLDSWWTGPWVITGRKGPSTVLLKVGMTTRGVHINRVHPLLTEDNCDQTVLSSWAPPLFHQEDGGTALTSADQVEQQIDPQTARWGRSTRTGRGPFAPSSTNHHLQWTHCETRAAYGWT